MSRSWNEVSTPHMDGRRADKRKLKKRSSKRARQSNAEDVFTLQRVRKELHPIGNMRVKNNGE